MAASSPVLRRSAWPQWVGIWTCRGRYAPYVFTSFVVMRSFFFNQPPRGFLPPFGIWGLIDTPGPITMADFSHGHPMFIGPFDQPHPKVAPGLFLCFSRWLRPNAGCRVIERWSPRCWAPRPRWTRRTRRARPRCTPQPSSLGSSKESLAPESSTSVCLYGAIILTVSCGYQSQ